MNEGRHFIGIDFSAARDAGKRIWIASAHLNRGRLVIENCDQARNLPGGGSDLTTALAALRKFLRGAKDAVIGLDFPFSLPIELIDSRDWREFVCAFPRRFLSPEKFRRACGMVSRKPELKRPTDQVARVPFSAYNIRLYRQTHAGIGAVLAPLVASDAVRVMPFQSPVAGKPTLVEICPASTLKRLRLYRSYKLKGDTGTSARSAILAALAARGIVAPLADDIRQIVIADRGGDALDAVLAAVGAARTADAPIMMTSPDPNESLEGRIFF